MYYINATPNTTGNYGNPQGQLFPNCIKLPDELLSDYLAYNGFVNLTTEGDTVTAVEPNTEAWEAWKATLPPEADPIVAAKTTKHTELSEACQSTIYNGATITLSDGSQQYFTYNEHDQTNIFEMYSAVKAGATQYIYQAQDESCMVYQAADIITIYSTLAALKTSTLTYYHQLTDYVDTLTSVEDINAVTFGQELTGEYLERYNELITVAAEQMNIVLGIADSSEDANNA